MLESDEDFYEVNFMRYFPLLVNRGRTKPNDVASLFIFLPAMKGFFSLSIFIFIIHHVKNGIKDIEYIVNIRDVRSADSMNT